MEMIFLLLKNYSTRVLFLNEVTRHLSYYYFVTQELRNESVDSESRD